MEEVWKDIADYEGLYQVSNLGNVLSLNYRGQGWAKKLTPKCNNSGRLWVELICNKKRKPMLIHRLVATAFLPNPNGYPQINHKDENPKNNHVDNLEWCTASYNMKYFYDRRRTEGGIKRVVSVRRSGKLMGRPIIQESNTGEFIRKWDNSRQIKMELGWNDWSISECCRGNRKTAYGYTWRYAS